MYPYSRTPVVKPHPLHDLRTLWQNVRSMNVRRAWLFLLLFLGTDLCFVLLHILKHTPLAYPSLVAPIDTALQIYHLVKLFVILLLLAYVFRVGRSASYLSWGLVFLIITFDDALLLHQRVGYYLWHYAPRFLRTLNLPSRIYELAILGLLGIFLGAMLLFVYRRGAGPFRRFSQVLLLFLAGLTFFGLIADAASVFGPGPEVRLALDILEDGGEMAVYSLIICYIFAFAVTRRGLMQTERDGSKRS